MEDRPGLILAGIVLLGIGAASIACGNDPAVSCLPEPLYGWIPASLGGWFILSRHSYFAERAARRLHLDRLRGRRR